MRATSAGESVVAAGCTR